MNGPKGIGSAVGTLAHRVADEARRVKAPISKGWNVATGAAQQPSQDEISTGRGAALRKKAASIAGSNISSPAARDAIRTDVNQVVDAFSKGLKKLGQGKPVASVPAGTTAAADAAKKENDAKVTAASSAIDRAVQQQGALDATATLNQQLSQVPPELRGRVLEKSAASLGQLTEKVTSLDKGGTAQAVRNLAKAADLAGPANSEQLTRPMAKAIADGRLEQKGDAANGGPMGIFKSANTHNSERELIDGVRGLGNSPGAQLFKDSLTSSLSKEGQASPGARGDRAQGMAAAVATGKSDLVPDKGFWTGVRNLGQAALDQVGQAVTRMDGAREKAINGMLDKTLGVSDSLKSLQPGDTFTLGLSGSAKVGPGVAGEEKLEVTRNADGTYTAKGAAAGTLGIEVGKTGVDVGAGAQVEYTFKDLAEATKGTQALAKMGMSANAMASGPGGTAASLLTQPSPDELALLGKSLSAVEVKGTAAAGLGAKLGLSDIAGLGADLGADVGSGVRLEFKDGKPSAVVGFQELNGNAGAALASPFQKLLPKTVTDPVKQATGVDLRDGQSVQGKAGLRIEERLPLNTSPVAGGSPMDQARAILANPTKLVGGTPSLSATFTGSVEGDGHGIEGQLKLQSLTPEQMRAAVAKLKQGDLAGAGKIAGQAVEPSYNRYEAESRGWLDHSLDFGVGSVGGTNSIHRVVQ